jgi:RNA polymerase sigma-70 factor (ECF subfamily)
VYRITTNLCLDQFWSAPRRSLPPETHPLSDLSLPLPKPVREPVWLEPFPDELLADEHSDPQERAQRSERISLAFLVALQHLTPTQRAVLLLREVLEWPTSEVAEWLSCSREKRRKAYGTTLSATDRSSGRRETTRRWTAGEVLCSPLPPVPC